LSGVRELPIEDEDGEVHQLEVDDRREESMDNGWEESMDNRQGEESMGHPDDAGIKLLDRLEYAKEHPSPPAPKPKFEEDVLEDKEDEDIPICIVRTCVTTCKGRMPKTKASRQYAWIPWT
jgi:hypothetical protein